MRKSVYLIIFMLSICIQAQQTYYPVSAGNGYGLRFWNSDTYKIHMGNTSEYKYGPVTDYSIKMNMSNTAGRGWTWGVAGATPIAGLNTSGNFQVAGSFLAGKPNETSDWNSLWQSGFYDGYNISNAPESNQWFWGINMNHRSNSSNYRYGGQIAIKNSSSSPTMYFRSTNEQGDGTWAKVLNSVGSQKISSTNTSLTIEGTGIGNYQGANLVLSASGINSVNQHASTHFIMHRGTDGIATIEFQRRNITGDYRGTPLLYKDGQGWRLDVANSETSTGMSTGLRINNLGNVGIGTTTPDEKLSVNGNIHAKEVRVDLTGWSDFVFDTDYNLPTLQEVEQHIKEKGHLQDIPSAEEVEEKGVLLGDMNAKLLQKIEELTLYTIEQEKKLQTQLEINKELLEKFKSQEGRIQEIEVLINSKKL